MTHIIDLIATYNACLSSVRVYVSFNFSRHCFYVFLTISLEQLP